jgi:hypothetical protein
LGERKEALVLGNDTSATAIRTGRYLCAWFGSGTATMRTSRLAAKVDCCGDSVGRILKGDRKLGLKVGAPSGAGCGISKTEEITHATHTAE